MKAADDHKMKVKKNVRERDSIQPDIAQSASFCELGRFTFVSNLCADPLDSPDTDTPIGRDNPTPRQLLQC